MTLENYDHFRNLLHVLSPFLTVRDPVPQNPRRQSTTQQNSRALGHACALFLPGSWRNVAVDGFMM